MIGDEMQRQNLKMGGKKVGKLFHAKEWLKNSSKVAVSVFALSRQQKVVLKKY
jgi:hypothetical protein